MCFLRASTNLRNAYFFIYGSFIPQDKLKTSRQAMPCFGAFNSGSFLVVSCHKNRFASIYVSTRTTVLLTAVIHPSLTALPITSAPQCFHSPLTLIIATQCCHSPLTLIAATQCCHSPLTLIAATHRCNSLLPFFAGVFGFSTRTFWHKGFGADALTPNHFGTILGFSPDISAPRRSDRERF